ncbi:MAG: putative membrane protein [Halovenus sp.]|mgnify:FL=1
MVYNLDVFEIFVVSIPRTRRVLTYIIGVSLFAGLLTTGAIVLSADLTAVTTLFLGRVEVPTVLVLAVAFVVAATLGGEATWLLVPAYPRNWAYYLSLVCLLVVATLVPVAILLGGVNGSPAPLWFALGGVFLSGFQILVVSDDVVGFLRQAPASAVQPALVFVGLTVATPLEPSLSRHAPSLAIVGAIGGALVVTSLFVEWLMRTNVSGVRVLEITSHLVQREPLHLGMGVEQSVPVQTFAVQTDGEQCRLAAPWVHPGVLEGIGGGRLTPNVIAALNGEQTAGDSSDRGFFWHVPSTHLSDSADPAVHESVVEAVGDPETVGQASRLLSRTYGQTTFHGRRYGDKRVVFFESEEYADIDATVFGDVIDPEETLVVDRHTRLGDTGRTEIYPESPEVDRLRENLRAFVDLLDEQPLAPYRAGDALDVDVDGISLYALVEEVDGQRTACVVADRNERPYALVDARERVREEFDEVLLFTTDTHASVTENRFDPQTRPDQIRDLILEASEAVTDAAAGLSANSVDVELLRSDYSGLILTLNILARVYILALGSLYGLLALGLVLV